MVKKTRRGGMFNIARKITRPIGHAALSLGKEYSKDYAKNKMPDVMTGIYNDPSVALDPEYILTARSKIPAPNIKIPSKRFDISNIENINPQTNISGGRSKRNKKRNKKRKTRKNRK